MLTRLLCGICLLASMFSAKAAEMTAAFTFEAGTTWHVDLAVINDGTPPSLSGFTVYFSELLYKDLALLASPAAWDSLVVQPDLALSSAGFLDSALLDRSQPLTQNQSQGGFSVRFTWLGSGLPAALPFDIVDENYTVLASGMTTAVPEPSIVWQMVAGLAVLRGAAQWRRRHLRAAGSRA